MREETITELEKRLMKQYAPCFERVKKAEAKRVAIKTGKVVDLAEWRKVK